MERGGFRGCRETNERTMGVIFRLRLRETSDNFAVDLAARDQRKSFEIGDAITVKPASIVLYCNANWMQYCLQWVKCMT